MKHIVTLLADTVCLIVCLLFRNSEVKGSLLILRTLIDLIDLFIVRKYMRSPTVL